MICLFVDVFKRAMKLDPPQTKQNKTRKTLHSIQSGWEDKENKLNFV